MKVMRFIAILIAAVVVVLLVACGSEGILGGGPEGEWEANQNRWRDAGMTSYGYEFRRVCFCPNTNLVRITVIDGVITAVHDVDSGTDLDSSEFRFYETVDDLFDIVRDALTNADSIEVTYDEKLGYPTQITIDFIANAIDDELWITASGVAPLLTTPQ